MTKHDMKNVIKNNKSVMSWNLCITWNENALKICIKFICNNDLLLIIRIGIQIGVLRSIINESLETLNCYSLQISEY